MTVSDFDFHLPKELIAQNPAEPRDSARLLVYDRLADTISHHQVRDLPTLLVGPTQLIANNTRVRHSRLFASYNQHPIEVLVLEPISGNRYRCIIGGKVRSGATLHFQTSKTDAKPLDLVGIVVDEEPHEAMTTFVVSFETEQDLETLFEQYGQVPLPPYITQSTARPEQYQTVFAGETGSAAAPTAGLHFTPELIEQLKQGGHSWEEVTLHVGMGTFLPLRKENITDNILHHEATFIDPTTAHHINQAKEKGLRRLAIGTTSTRTLEAHTIDNHVQPGWLSTNLFIYPGYSFKTVNALLTNFHLPKSSLLLLVAAFIGNHPEHNQVILTETEMLKRLHRIYQEAINQQYRFFSFGDAMLIL